MRLKDYDDRDGKKVWLDQSEVADFIDEAQTPQQRVAFLLGARVGLRREEIVSVRPADFVETTTGHHLRVWEDYSKTDSYREPPIPDELANIVTTLAFDLDADEPVVDVDGKTVYRWVKRAADRRRAATRDEGWKFLGPHDLRRTWGTHLLESGVVPSLVMAWGGWEDWDTFREHYLGEFSPDAVRRERGKVVYLDGHDGDEHEPVVTGPIAARAGVSSGRHPQG